MPGVVGVAHAARSCPKGPVKLGSHACGLLPSLTLLLGQDVLGQALEKPGSRPLPHLPTQSSMVRDGNKDGTCSLVDCLMS